MRTIYVDKNYPRMLLMKAAKPVWQGAVFSAASPAHFATLPDPELPGPRWVRLQNRICGICATDLSLLMVDADPKIAPAALPGNQRFYLGHEVVSVVTEAGPEVSSVRVGDRVIMDTSFFGPTCASQEIDPPCPSCQAGNRVLCENASLPTGMRAVGGGWGDSYIAHETEVYAVPDDISDEQATMIEPLSVGIRSVLRRLPMPGVRVLVLGSGIIGLTVIEAARALAPECHITAVARHSHQAVLAKALGADEVVRGENGYDATARLTGAQLYKGTFGVRMLLGGFDIVFDCVGSSATLQDSLRWTRAGGAVVLVGVKMKPMHVDLTPVWYQEVDLIGIVGHGMETWEGRRVSTFDLTVELLRQGKLPIDGLITHRFPLDQWRKAIDTSQDKRSGAVKVVFEMG